MYPVSPLNVRFPSGATAIVPPSLATLFESITAFTSDTDFLMGIGATKYFINHFLDHFIGWNFGLSVNRNEDLKRELEELKKYKAIGTVEECKEAADKQKAIKPNLWGDGYYNGELVIDMYECPNCGKNYELECEEYDYCPNCGQKLDWSE